MKLNMVILVAIVVTTSSNSPKSSKSNKPHKPPKKINVTNWQYYQLKQELQVKSLKKILDSMTKFKKLESCPLGYGNCRNTPIKYVLTRIIAAALEKEKREAEAQAERNKTLECEALLNKTETNRTHEGKPQKMKFGSHYRAKLT
ncbi:hypothetical protein MSG28_008564 [Choristoneura fumiferana]|uniref:Uncharacterized protein n=1 Tax=Choristoneura fumiferana TaxID=7141 RepID=A0ACC0J771_CHOFU|nr:hypothetical protein MSG28_008564 [Choristoneura fumiferana]